LQKQQTENARRPKHEKREKLSTINSQTLKKRSPATMTEVQASPPSASAAKPPWFETQIPSVQFSLLACGLFLFWGLHNLLQEAMMNIEGFKFGVMLGYMEVLG
jgi:hypothetical protein